MTYKDEITALGEISFDKIRRVAFNYVMTHSDKERDLLFESLNHGVDFLSSDAQMKLYIYSFGKMHQAKVNRIPAGTKNHRPYPLHLTANLI